VRAIFVRIAGLAVGVVLVVTGAWGGTASYADPPGTVRVTTLSVPSRVTLLGGNEAGLAYKLDTELGENSGPARILLKAPGADPVLTPWPDRVAPEHLVHFTMAGRMLFVDWAGTVWYSIWDGPVHTCAAPGALIAFLPTGWAYIDPIDNDVKIVTATESGCTTRTFLSNGPDFFFNELLGGDAGGLVILTLEIGTANTSLGYYPSDDPAHPVTLSKPAGALNRAGSARTPVQAGAVLAEALPGPVRIPLDGSPSTILPAGTWKAMTATQVVGGDFTGLRTVPVTGGAVSTRPGDYVDIASDGTSFFTDAAPDEPPGIYARTTADGPATLAVPPPPTMHPSYEMAIGLSPGQVYYTDLVRPIPYPAAPFTVRTRVMTIGPGMVAIGPEQPIADVVTPGLSASSGGRLAFDGNHHRDLAGRISTVPTEPSYQPEMSGNRWLVPWSYFSNDRTVSGRGMYDVRTGRVTAGTAWPQGPQDLFGNYLLYAATDGRVRLRNLVTGTETVPRGPGAKIGAVALHSRWAAWVTACPTVTGICAQTLTVRDLATGSTRNLSLRGIRQLDLSGGYLGFDTVLTTTRALRVLQLSTGKLMVIGNLPQRFAGGSEVDQLPPRHFDLEDEVIGWIDSNHVGKLAHLARFIDPPRYLGNAIAPASFSSTWSLAFPVSKPLPSCTVTFLRGITTVRVLGCANTSGMVHVTWDGRSATGALVPAGTYTYRVSGRDDDGYWMRHYDGTLRSVTGTATKIS
jgi:hypothetical protein